MDGLGKIIAKTVKGLTAGGLLLWVDYKMNKEASVVSICKKIWSTKKALTVKTTKETTNPVVVPDSEYDVY